MVYSLLFFSLAEKCVCRNLSWLHSISFSLMDGVALQILRNGKISVLLEQSVHMSSNCETLRKCYFWARKTPNSVLMRSLQFLKLANSNLLCVIDGLSGLSKLLIGVKSDWCTLTTLKLWEWPSCSFLLFNCDCRVFIFPPLQEENIKTKAEMKIVWFFPSRGDI